MTHSRPRITGTTHTLPFDRLSPRDFERLCLWLVEREGFERAEHLGAAGSEQGRDLVAWREGKLWAFQCKRVRNFGPRDALAEVEKVLGLREDQRPAGLVFLVTCDVSANTRRQARIRCGEEMECQFWAGTELDERVKGHPDILEEFFFIAGRDRVSRVARFFGFGPDEQRAQRNRRAMLKLVKDFWVKGVLEQSLYGAAMIELGLEERADAVERPWDVVLQVPGQPNRPLSRGTKIVDVFDDRSQAILILGAPGSGKTTMLLELARDTIVRAEEDLAQPVPVVLNLSSWAEKKQPIAEWLVEELSAKYNVPGKIARPWVENDELSLLLDGLDEVAQEHREACIRAVNDFRQEHGLAPLVVCSRIAEYEALTTKLKLRGAVLLQPLTPQQVEEYLDGAGTELSAVHEILQSDIALQELAQTPLMLSIMTLAYRGVSVEDLQRLDTVEARRKDMFEAYVQRMFRRRRADQLHSPRQTIYWLAWLAQEMTVHGQTVFLIEGLQPDWLATRVRRQVLIVTRLVGGLFAGLVGGLFAGLVVGLAEVLIRRMQVLGQRERLFEVLFVGLSAGLFVGLIRGLESVVGETVMGPNAGIRRSAKNVLLIGLVGMLVFGLVFGLIVGPVGGLAGGLVGMVVGWFVVGLGRRLEWVEPVETFRWSWRKARTGLLLGLVFGPFAWVVEQLIVVVSVGLYVGTSVSLVGELVRRMVEGLGSVLSLSLFFGLFFGLIRGLESGVTETKIVPNQGIRRSAKNALLVGLVGTLVFGPFGGPFGAIVGGFLGELVGGLVGTSAGELVAQLVGVLAGGLVGGLVGGVVVGLFFGGGAVILHFALRYAIYRDGYLPWNLVRFLDFAAERIFLRKVGGGYIFIHRLLQDYFASLYQDQ